MNPNISRAPLFGELVQILGCLLLLAVAIALVAEHVPVLALGLAAGVAALRIGRWLRTDR